MFRYRLGIFPFFTIFTFRMCRLHLGFTVWASGLATAMCLLSACTKAQLPVSLVKIDSPENPDVRVQVLTEGDPKAPFSHLVRVPSSTSQLLPGFEKYLAIKYCECEIVFSRRNPASEMEPIADLPNLNIRPNTAVLPWKKIDSLNAPWIKVRKDAGVILFAWDKDVLQEVILKNERNELFILYVEKSAGGTP